MMFLLSAFAILLVFAALGAAGLALLLTRQNTAMIRRLAAERNSASAGKPDPGIGVMHARIEDLTRKLTVLESSWESRLAPTLTAGTSGGPDSTPPGSTADSPGAGGSLGGASSRAGLQPIAGSINLSRRNRALKFLRRGDSPEHVAAALDMPISDIRLLAKLRLLNSPRPEAVPMPSPALPAPSNAAQSPISPAADRRASLG